MKLVYKQELDKDDGELDGYGAVFNTTNLLCVGYCESK